MKYKHNINSEISITYIVTKKKLTMVAALGVTIGIAIYIFMNSMMAGFDRKSNETMFKSTAHIRVYKDDVISEPLDSQKVNANSLPIIINPKVVPESQKIVNPHEIIALLRNQQDVTIATPQVAVSVFYNNGRSQITGNSSGVIISEADKLYDLASIMVEGSMADLKSTPNGILLGVGIADKMNVKTGNNITITSSKNVTKVMKVVGLFKTSNSAVDKTKSYINIAAAQQLLQEGPSYVSDINIDVTNFDAAPAYSEKFSALTGYKAEDWKAANETLVAASKMRRIIITVISLSILLVAGFGIYNILNMTISQKLNDIAILKAMGFRGSDVIRIFVLQALLIGFIGIMIGILFALFLVWILSKVYIGGDIGYFPIRFEPRMFIQGSLFGFIITVFAGYIPAKNAANVDPVSILRK
jgi:lipoprotein-releasing system permease protein